jgi:acetoin utilization protein AcuB
MTQELVKDNMTASVKTVSPDTSLTDAHYLMISNKIRRLPVVDGNKLLGIVTLTDVLQAQPSDATSLSVWEMNYLLVKLTVKKIMTAPVKSISQDASIKEAAEMMLNNKFGGIPVVDAEEKLVGMITESDIFRFVVQHRFN